MPINQTGARMDTAANEYRDEWQKVPLASAADIRFSNVNKISQPGEEPVRLCNYTDVYNNDYVTADMDFMRATATRSEIERFGLQAGDVIITKDSETPNDIGIPTVVDTTAPYLVCGYHLALLRPNQDLVDPTFLAKQLAHHRIARYFGQQANGTTRYGLSTAAIAKTPLHLPRPDSQRSASALMRLVDTNITQTEAVIAKLKQVRAGMLRDLLSYGLDEHGRLRDPIAHPEQFKESPLGRIPREWDVFTIKELASIRTGDKDTQDRVEYGKYPFYVRSDVVERINSYSFDGEAILTAGDGVGVGKVVHYAIGRFDYHQRGYNIHNFSKDTCGRFLYYYFKEHFYSRISAMSAKTSVDSVRMDMIANMKVPTLRIQEQIAIANTLSDFEVGIAMDSEELKKLKSLKSGLQDDLLTGRVRIPKTIAEGVVVA